MADGRRLDPNMNVAASKTLPFGSVVKVTNLENGRSTMVQIEVRGPYVHGRVVDLAPRPANQLGIGHQGTVPVVVKPITLPRPDGSVVLGAGAADTNPQELRRAVEVTRELAAQKPA
jgi:rare lipoprotein A